MSRAYDKRRWRRLSTRVLRERITCEDGDCNALATEVHHIDGLGPAGPRGYDRDNLLALCNRHHSAITNASRRKRKRPVEPHPGITPDSVAS